MPRTADTPSSSARHSHPSLRTSPRRRRNTHGWALWVPASSSSLFPSDSQSYLLGFVAITPLIGRLSDLIGRKPLLYVAILTFMAFSAMCGAAPTMAVLIVGRAIQGVGAGMIIVLTLVSSLSHS